MRSVFENPINLLARLIDGVCELCSTNLDTAVRAVPIPKIGDHLQPGAPGSCPTMSLWGQSSAGGRPLPRPVHLDRREPNGTDWRIVAQDVCCGSRQQSVAMRTQLLVLSLGLTWLAMMKTPRRQFLKLVGQFGVALSKQRLVVGIAVLGVWSLSCGDVATPFNGPQGQSPTTVTQFDATTSTTESSDLGHVVEVVFGSSSTVSSEYMVVDRQLELPTSDGGEASSITLTAEPHLPLGGALVPSVVPDQTGSALFYTATENLLDIEAVAPGESWGVPTIRRFDVATGADEKVLDGGYAPTISHSGLLAYAQDVNGEYRKEDGHLTRLAVLDGSSATIWTGEEEARFTPYGWAGDILIAYVTGEGESLSVVALDGPGQLRQLSAQGYIGAISPDGTQVLLIELTVSESGSLYSLIKVVNASDGVVVATYEPSRDPDFAVILGYGGDWKGQRAVVLGPGGFAVFDIGASSISPVGIFQLSFEKSEGALSPVWLLDDSRVWTRAMVSTDKGFAIAGVECNIVRIECANVSDLVSSDSAFATVGNMSRPQP